jgi:TolB-like protein/Flp pilus assembly protein TadD
MAVAPEPPGDVVRFGVFEFDLQSGELFKQGRRLRLSGQPARILALLVCRPGEMITREELRELLWPGDTHVNFEQSLNAAITRLRHVLGDSPENPRFIETMARRGYRFIAPASAPQQHAPAYTIRSIAVLPFENATSDPDADYLIDGITEAVINSVSRLPGMRVLARSTVFRYRGKPGDGRSLGRKLNVGAVLLGRASKRSNDLMIRTELVDVQNGWLIWGEQFSCGLSDVLRIEAEISGKILEKLRSELAGKTDRPIGRRQTTSNEAYQDYLKGRYHWNRISADGMLKSVGYFQEALKRDPEFALAHAGLADAYGLQGLFGMLPPDDAMPKSKRHAIRALEIDPDLAEAHTALAGVLKHYERDWLAAEQRYRQALDLNPNYVHAYRGYAALLSARSRFDEAMSQIGRAHELDPLSVIVSMEMAWNLFLARDYQQAIHHALRVTDLEPEFPSAQFILGLACEQTGKCGEAEAALQRSVAISQGHSSGLASLGHLYATTGRTTEAQGILDRLDEAAERGYVAPFWHALVHAGLGDTDAAMEQLERSYTTRDMWLMWINTDPRLDGLRADSRFRDLLVRVGFEMSGAVGSAIS